MEGTPTDPVEQSAGCLPAPGKAWVPLACLAALYAVFYAMSLSTVPMGDDWGLVSLCGRDTWGIAWHRYTHLNPRLAEDLLTWASGLPCAMLIWKLLNPLVILWLCVSLTDIAVDRDRTGRTRYLWLLLGCSLIFFTMGGNRAWNQFWMAGSCNWLWSHAFIACMFSLLVRACRGRAMGWARYALLGVCGLVAGWSTETSALTSAGIFGLMTLLLCRKGRRAAFLAAGIGLATGLAFFFGSLVFMIGVTERTGLYGPESEAFMRLGLLERYLQPIPFRVFGLGLPAALLACLAMHTRPAQGADAGKWRKYRVALPVVLLLVYSIHAQFMAVYPALVYLLLWKAMERTPQPTDAPEAGIPYAKIIWILALAGAFLPLPLSLKWSSHATLLYPSLILITGCIHYAARLKPEGVRLLCKAGAAWAVPYILLAAATLVGLNRHLHATEEGIRQAVACGRKEILLPALQDYVPEYGDCPYLMDAHIQPYLWELGEDPDDFLNRNVARTYGLSDDYRLIFKTSKH